VSPLQNFSASAVDIGVNCDWILNDTLADGSILPEYVFANPLFGIKIADTIPTVTGSSYAAPIITGRIAAGYHQLFKGGSVDKETAIGLMPGINSNGQWPNPPIAGSALPNPSNPLIPMAFTYAGPDFKMTIKNQILTDGFHYFYKNK